MILLIAIMTDGSMQIRHCERQRDVEDTIDNMRETVVPAPREFVLLTPRQPRVQIERVVP